MGPRGRAVLVMSLLMMFLWAAHVVWSVLLGTGLDTHRYAGSVLLLAGGALAGFVLVWAATLLGDMRRNLSTGFEAGVTDEFGTEFQMATPDGKSTTPFKMSLTKFLPQLVAPPDWPGLHPLEAELIGFLQGYRHWPVNLNAQNKRHEASPGREFASLYELAVARWQVMRQIPGATHWHRIAALSKDLALVHAFVEKRSSAPLSHFWKRDSVKFTQRCQAHGGITAFLLSTFPAFRAMKGTAEGEELQRTLLIALRYHATPHQLPLNSTPLAREIVDYLWRADAQLQQLDVRELDQMDAEQLDELRTNMASQWPALLNELEPASSLDSGTTCLKLADGSVWLKQEALLHVLAPLLKPTLRQTLGLWDTSGGLQHPAWPHLANQLQEAGFIAREHDGQNASNGCFTLLIHTHMWGPVLKLTPDAGRHTAVLKRWHELPSLPDQPEVVMDLQQLTAFAHVQAGHVDAKLSEMF
ncbi:MAG: hypothetical protein DI628_08550 [Blastochloris viridis]|uniref:Uncharacterized protein n=1 Tax=Blastochloris viridis TaxID=1079 RepID=A0A6N4R0M7_BLAVI|nr:MAG: hypothetical protein DI628_08550 [Blastochloris viridis]